jgi:hypothetical protein
MITKLQNCKIAKLQDYRITGFQDNMRLCR